MVSSGNFARIANFCAGFRLGTLRGFVFTKAFGQI